MTPEFRGGPDARGRQNVGPAERPEALFRVGNLREWRANIGVRGCGGGRAEARNPFVVVKPWTPWGSNSEYRRLRAVG